MKSACLRMTQTVVIVVLRNSVTYCGRFYRLSGMEAVSISDAFGEHILMK